MNKITVDSTDKMTVAPNAPFKGLRVRPAFQKCSAVGTSMRRNKKATIAAQATNDTDQIPMTTAKRFKLRNSPNAKADVTKGR